MITSKDNMLCILRILEEYSDENHILTVNDIAAKLRLDYQKEKVDRRTIYSAVKGLEDLGYDISDYEENHIGYYLRERRFSAAEIRLLLDAVYSCKYISKKQSEELLEKIRSFLSVNERKKYSYTTIINPEKKSPNPEVFLNIEVLDQAISEKRKISFDYYEYNDRKELVKHKEKRYVASPYALVCDNEHYYLVLIQDDETEKGPKFFRVDLIKDIVISDEKISISRKEAKLDNIKHIVYAYSGEPGMVELLCDRTGLRYCIDKFGKDITVEPKDGRYRVVVTAAAEGMVYWALQFIKHVEVVKPDSLRGKIKDALKESKY